MPSKSRIAFDRNAEDIERLLEFHKDQGGVAKGRRYGLEVLNKSAIVLLTSFWEAYCEDIAAEALEHIVAHAPSADKLPLGLQKVIAKELKAPGSHELAIWELSDSGWRDVLKKRLASLQLDRNRLLNTPKSAKIDDLFLGALGIPKISDSWRWPTRMTAAKARSKLDHYVELRGSIAHRGAALTSVKKVQVTDYFDFLKRLVGRTGAAVRRHVDTVTPVRLWK
jgi:hypothetical protein